MKKTIILLRYLLFCTFLLVPFSTTTSAEEITVHDQYSLITALEKAVTGDVILMREGVYPGPIKVEKSVTLKGEDGAKILGGDTGHVLIIKADGVTVENLMIEGGGTQNAGIYITSNLTTILNNQIKNVFHGIQTKQSYGHVIKNNAISSFVDRAEMKGYGIYIHETEQSTVTENHISWVQDGIYNSFANNNQIVDNKMEYARYGIHTMDSKYVAIAGNEVILSHIGAMIMQSNFLTIKNNLFHSNTTVDGVGLFMFDSFDSLVVGNVLQDNHKGMQLMNDMRNTIRSNDISKNNIGLELGENSSDNIIYHNNFQKNIHQVVTDKKNQNTFESDGQGNYWDEQKHLDLDEDRIVDYSYRSGSAFYPIVEKEPLLQIFFESPAVQLWNMIEKFTNLPSDMFIIDQSPLQRPLVLENQKEKTEVERQLTAGSSVSSMLLFTVGIGFTCWQIWITRRRYE